MNNRKLSLTEQKTLKRFRQFITAVGASPVRFFVYMSLVFGLIFLGLTPPFQAPDESVHFYRSYQIASFNFVPDTTDGVTGGNLPSSLGEFALLTSTNPSLNFNPNVKYNLRKTYSSFSIRTDQKKVQNYDFASTALYPPVSYVPQAIGVFIGKIIHLPITLIFYLGRITNLVAWVGLIALAISLMPRRKWALVALGLLPMILFQAASYSSDVMAIGITVVFFAYVLRLVDRQKMISRRELLMLLVLAIVMVLSKQLMFILLPLVLIIPSKLFGGMKKSAALKLLLIVSPLLLYGLWTFCIRDVNVASSYTNGQLPALQAKYVLQNPHSYVNVLWNTYSTTWGDTITRSFVGDFGWVDTPLAEHVVVVGYLGLFLAYVVSTDNVTRAWLNNKQKYIVVGTAALYWLAVSTALYLYYNAVGFKIIVGLQGRYFFPFALLLIPLFYGGWLKTNKKNYHRIVTLIPVFLLVMSAYTIFIRYYIHNV